MNRTDVIEKYKNEIIDTMVEYYEATLRFSGRVEYDLYIWEDGEIEMLETVSSSNSWLKPEEWEQRELFYVLTVRGFNVWDSCDEEKPEDETKAEEMEDIMISELVHEYKNEQVYIDFESAVEE